MINNIQSIIKHISISTYIAFCLTGCSASGIDHIYKGEYTWGAEVNVFQQCAEEKVYWVSASSPIRGELIDFHNQSTSKPYESIYIVFRGHLLDEELDGFAKQYDGLIRISEIINKEAKIPVDCN